MKELLSFLPAWMAVAFGIVLILGVIYAFIRARDVEFLGLKIRTTRAGHKQAATLSDSGLRYYPPGELPSIQDLVRTSSAAYVTILASSCGRSMPAVTELLTRGNVTVTLMCSAPSLGLLTPANIEECKASLRQALTLCRESGRARFYTLRYPPSVGFALLSDVNQLPVVGLLYWYTFYNGFARQRGRGQNGAILARKGASADADLLLEWMRAEAQRKLQDKTLREIKEVADIDFTT